MRRICFRETGRAVLVSGVRAWGSRQRVWTEARANLKLPARDVTSIVGMLGSSRAGAESGHVQLLIVCCRPRIQRTNKKLFVHHLHGCGQVRPSVERGGQNRGCWDT